MEFDTRAACYCWIEREAEGRREVLLTHFVSRHHADGRQVSGWTLPGGGMELDETPQQTAVREVAEETGYVIRLGELLGVRNHWIGPERRMSPGDRPLHALQLVWRAQVLSGDLVVEAEGSTTDASWFALEDVGSTLDVVPLVAEAARWAHGSGAQG